MSKTSRNWPLLIGVTLSVTLFGVVVHDYLPPMTRAEVLAGAPEDTYFFGKLLAISLLAPAGCIAVLCSGFGLARAGTRAQRLAAVAAMLSVIAAAIVVVISLHRFRVILFGG
jgi:hypothetical protein